MSHSAGGAQVPSSQERSAGELVKELSEQVSVLVREELRLARLEMTRKGKSAGMGAGMLGGGGLVLLAVAGAVALAGKSRLQGATPPIPTEAVGSVKADVEEIKERARR